MLLTCLFLVSNVSAVDLRPLVRKTGVLRNLPSGDNLDLNAGAIVNVSGVMDADKDTKVMVEESTDEDKIRLYTAGVERVVVDESGNIAIDTDALYYDKANKRWGFGTTSPGAKLDIEGGTLMVDSNGANGGLTFKKLDNTGAWSFGTGGENHRTLQLYRIDGGIDERWIRFDALNQYGEGSGIHLRPGGHMLWPF